LVAHTSWISVMELHRGPLIDHIQLVVAQPDTHERLAARDAFRALLNRVVVTPADRREFEITVERIWPPCFRRTAILQRWVRGQDLNL
jgi:hypothetical protein